MLPGRLFGTMLVAAFLAFGFNGAMAGEAETLEAPELPPVSARSALPDLYTVSAHRIDATAGSVILARDAAMAQGRSDAWTKLYRRLTVQAQWDKQPQLSDGQLLRLVRNFEVSGERRSTTRYLADVTYRFNPAAVRLVLRQANIPYTDLRARPALVIPLIEDKGFAADHPWTAVWKNPVFLEGVAPMVPVEARDAEFLSRPDLLQLDFAGLQPLLENRDADRIVLAIASEDGNTLQVIEISETGRNPSAFGFAMSDAMANANVAAETVAENWKGRNALDFGARARLVADVRFNSQAEWMRLRAQLRAVRAVTDVDVVGMSVNEAEISVSYFGRIEQLKDLLAQQNLELSGPPAAYSLEPRRAAAAAMP
jgi:Uncharacterized protein conserved in bacteria (DUF2066)